MFVLWLCDHDKIRYVFNQIFSVLGSTVIQMYFGFIKILNNHAAPQTWGMVKSIIDILRSSNNIELKSSADYICKKFGPRSGQTDSSSVLSEIQIVLHVDSVPESLFWNKTKINLK